MPIEITMPALSPTMEEGNLARWLVKEGDAVGPGDVIAEIETDKATMEVEAVDEGTMARIVVPEGSEGVKVNALIAVMAGEGESVEDAAANAGSGGSPGMAGEPSGPVDVDPAATAATTDGPSVDDADAHGKPDMGRTGNEPSGQQGASRHGGSSGQGGSTASGNGADPEGGRGAHARVFASPLARRLAKQAGIDLSAVSGSGPHGRIVKSDIERAEKDGTGKAGATSATSAKSDASAPKAPTADATPAAGAPATGRAVQGMSDAAVLKLYKEGEYEKKPHDGMRRVIAERLTESSQTIPSYNITVDVSLDALLALRGQVNAGAPKDADGKPAFKLSVNDFIVKAMAIALQRVPMANASWTSTDRILHRHSDVGVAVAVPDGLFTPIVRRAEEKSLSRISAEVKDVAARAKAKKLRPDEYQGGSTAVSNLGMFGVSAFTSIINPPHASIVSIGAGVEQPVVRDGKLAVGTVMSATFAFDHRVIDGALGAELAAAFREAVESPMALLV